jgi:ATP-binding cassette, subfamily B, multidrug efflux pump
MTTHFEEDSPSVNLLNREVIRLLFSYLFRYRRHLAVAVVFVAIITGARLLVPYCSGFMIDHFLVKKGFIVSTARTTTVSSVNHGPQRQLDRAVELDDTTRFLFQSRLTRLSAGDVERLKSSGVLSSQAWTLIESPPCLGAIERKIREGMADGAIRRYAYGRHLFSDAAFARFSAPELAVLRVADWRRVLLASLFVIGLFLVQFAASYLQIVALMKLSQFAMRDLRLDLYRHILSLELKYFDKNPVGRLVNRVSNDIETLNEMFSSVLVALFQDMVIMAGIVVVMFFTDLRLALVVCAAFPFLAVITVAFRIKVRGAYRLIRTKIAHLNAFLNENITGIRITQIFGREAKQYAKFEVINREAYDANVKQLMIYAVFRPLIDFFRWAVVAAIIFFGAQMIVHATLSYGVIVMFLAYIASLFEPLGDIAEKFDILQSANAAGEKILTVLKTDATRELDSKDAVAAFRAREGAPAQGLRFRGEIRFDDVWCAYTPGEWVLRGVSFSIPPRTTLAIVGETGSGKSTIVNLLARLYPYQKGRISVDGIDIEAVPYSLLRSNMAVVMQELFLFSRNVRENLVLGAPFDEKKWDEIVKAAHVDRLLARLPAGADEPVMERGATFSAGERQLCAFARALYADPAVLVLDEATSNIDSSTEHLIQDALRRLVRDRTSIIIAHRLSTVRSADRIIVLDKGVIAEEGDHASLMARKGLYHELYRLQFDAV